MAQRHKVTVRTQPENYRLTSDERRAARFAAVAGRQGELKKEAAERRAKRAQQAEAPGGNPTKD